jgi:outer membrane protein insertion porin family
LNSKHLLLFGLALAALTAHARAAGLGGLDPLPAPPVSGDVVTDLTVTGAQSISGEKVLALVRQRRVEPLSTQVLNEDQRIWKMGLFRMCLNADPTSRARAVLTLRSPTPGDPGLRFFGNKRSARTMEKAALEPKSTYDQDKVAAAVRALEDYYKSKNFYAAEVSVDTKPGKENGEVVVNFRISEGNKMKIEKIDVVGAKIFSANRVKGAMKDTQEAGWFSAAPTARQDPDDYEAILKMYAREGYVKAKLDNVGLESWGDRGREVVRNSTTFDEANKRIVLRFKVDEGIQFRLGGITITGNTLFSDAELRERVDSLQAKVFNQDQWDADLARLRSAYSEKGYIYANVQPEYKWDEEAGTVSAVLTIQESTKAYIEEIRIRHDTTQGQGDPPQ